jgi:ribosomal protein S18 acetylase RimI-like enzyme
MQEPRCHQVSEPPQTSDAALPVELRLDLPEHLRPAAARLYWLAFGGKLSWLLGPEARALRYLEITLRADHSIAAVSPDASRLYGIAGFKSPSGSFAGGTLTDMQGAYGVIGAAWRSWILSRLSREIDNERFLIDGISVSPEIRSRGVGQALIEALCDEGRRRGYGEIRLEVIDTNWRARKLYLRCGFVDLKTEPIGFLQHIFGFAAATTMVRRLD